MSNLPAHPWLSGLPKLCVIIDTEEEFDWNGPFRREARSVATIKAQHHAQKIFARYGIVPTYVIDHPVVSDTEAVARLREWQDAETAVIGSHLHPWVNPPFEEELGSVNSYPGNLSKNLEYRKLSILTQAIEDAFGRRPQIYKAGRYGIGPNTAQILAKLGYKVDLSIVPYTDFSADGGPDFRKETPVPRLLQGTEDILGLPLSVGFSGRLRRVGPSLYPALQALIKWRAPGIFARTGLLERIRLSPEGQDCPDHIRLTKALLKDGLRLFSYTYHSPSLMPGHTPYVRCDEDLGRFLDNMDRYFDFFFGELNGESITPLELYNSWVSGGASAEKSQATA